MAAALSAMLATLARWGYHFGVDDQVVLSLKGIAHADPTAYVNDWFTQTVPQPHWLFDGVTYVGERLGVLPLAYLAWWIASFVAFGFAAVWLTRRFLPGQPWMALLVGPTLAFGQSTAMGSSSALYGLALPGALGACLGFLTLAALITNRWRTAAAGAVLAALAHVQHGADLAPILLLAAVLATTRPRAHRFALAAVGAALVAQAALVGRLRGIENAGAGWLEACRQAIPFHCDANTWTVAALAGGGLVVAATLAFAVSHARQDWRTSVPALALPAAALLGAALADRFDVPFLGHMAQRYNVYRYAGFVLPTAAFALVWMVGRLQDSWSPGRAVGLAGLLLAWLTVSDAAFHYARPASVALALLLAVAFVLTAPDRRGRVPRSVVAIPLLLAATVANSGFAPVHLGYDTADPRVVAALDIGRAVPPSSVIVADPRISWLRRVSRRAVVAECKGIAFGGAAWTENTRRMGDLGGWAQCFGQGEGFLALSPARVEALTTEYGSTHVLVSGDDPKLAHALAHWTLVRELPPRRSALLERGWWLFELPTAG